MTGRFARPIARQVASLLLAGLTLACAPHIEIPGPATTDPTLTATHFRMADGMQLPLRIWPAKGPARTVILAVHGFNDYSHAFEEAGIWLAERDITVYAYDQRGFGETDAGKRGLWPGTEALTGDLKTASELLRVRHPNLPLFLLGESMGGAVVIAAMTGPEPPQVAGAILVAPAVWGREAMPWYQRAALAAASHTLPWLKLSGKGLGLRPSDNDEMLRELSRDPLFIKKTRIDAMHGITDLMDAALAAAPEFNARALILHGAKDEIIPQEPTFLMLDRLPTAARGRQRIGFYENGFHMLLRDLQAETVWRDIAAWIADPDAPLPSGADVAFPDR